MMQHIGKNRVLVVDDEFHILEGMKRIINRSETFEVAATFLDGKEALDWLNKNSIDIILSDIRMPEMDGLELSSKISKIWPQTKIILLTGHAEFDYAQQALRMGVLDYILKPCSSEKILETLERVSNNSCSNVDRSYSYINVNHDNPWVNAATKYIQEHYNKELSVEQIAKHVYLSPSYFSTLFKETTGYTVNNFVHLLRIEKSKQLLTSLEYKGYEIANVVGYKTFRHFNEVFKKFVGQTPSEYRRQFYKGI